MLRHFVITRFLCCDFGYGKKVQSTEFINEGIRLLNKFFVPTLINQSNHNFEVIFAIHDAIPIENVRGLNSISIGNIKKHVVRWSKVNDFINSTTTHGDILITSRLDYDDLVYTDAVESIHRRAIETKTRDSFGMVIRQDAH